VENGKNETALRVRAENTALRNKTSQVSIIQGAEVGFCKKEENTTNKGRLF
jgi:hypothetical protein